MRESLIEQHLRIRVLALGGFIRKVKWIGAANAPDRYVSFSTDTRDINVFVELKATGKKPTPAQFREFERMKEAGTLVRWFNSKDGIDQWLRTL